MNKYAGIFFKLYNALPIFGPIPLFIKRKHRYVYSMVYYCKTYKYNPFTRGLLYPATMVLWFFKAIISVYRNVQVNAVTVKLATGIGIFNQTQHLFNLAFFKNVLPDYYYYLKLYHKNIIITENYLVDNHFFPLFGFLSNSSSRTAINNKLDFWLKLNPVISQTIDTLALVTQGQIEFFNLTKGFPETDIFLKPVNGYGGRDCYRLNYIGDSQYQVEASKIIFNKTNLALFLKKIANKEDFILQPNLSNHPVIQNISNGNLSTCRIATYFDKGNEIQVLFGMFLMPVDDSISSNTNGISASVNIETGALSAAINLGNIFERINFHPQGNGKITGSILPFWEDAKNLCKKAHNEFKDLPIIGWDIAFTQEGVFLVEGNLGWSVEYWQLTQGDSFNADEFISLLEWHLKKKTEKF